MTREMLNAFLLSLETIWIPDILHILVQNAEDDELHRIYATTPFEKVGKE